MSLQADLVGTWFPTGYFGHFRSKTRNDILQEYRHAAAPSPPEKFTQRVRLCPDRHTFSKHDNKHSFPTDASYFDSGLGRRKSGRSSTIFKPDLISWIPDQAELRKEGAAMSVYRLNFRHGDTSPEPAPQRLSPRIRRRMAYQEDDYARQKYVTDYKMYFQHGQPNNKLNTDFNTGKEYDGTNSNTRSYHDVNTTGHLSKTVPHYLAHTEAVKRRIKSAPLMRLGVSDCLMWPQKQLNESIIIPNRYDKKSQIYRFRNPLQAKIPRKFKSSKPPTKEQSLKPPTYHTREDIKLLRPPVVSTRPQSERRAESYVRVPSTASVTQESIPYNDAEKPTMTPRPGATTSRYEITPAPPVTPRQPVTPRDTTSTPLIQINGGMTPAATPVTYFAPTETPLSPTWVTQNPIPTVVVN